MQTIYGLCMPILDWASHFWSLQDFSSMCAIFGLAGCFRKSPLAFANNFWPVNSIFGICRKFLSLPNLGIQSLVYSVPLWTLMPSLTLPSIPDHVRLSLAFTGPQVISGFHKTILAFSCHLKLLSGLCIWFLTYQSVSDPECPCKPFLPCLGHFTYTNHFWHFHAILGL